MDRMNRMDRIRRDALGLGLDFELYSSVMPSGGSFGREASPIDDSLVKVEIPARGGQTSALQPWAPRLGMTSLVVVGLGLGPAFCWVHGVAAYRMDRIDRMDRIRRDALGFR